MDSYGQDMLLVPAGTAALLGYHLYLLWQLRHHPTATTHGFGQLGRKLWIHAMVKDKDKKSVLAVQQIRNTLMEIILMASISITFCTGIAVFVNSSYGYRNFILAAHDDSSTVVLVKVMLPLACFLSSFFCCVQSVILLADVSFLVNTTRSPEESVDVAPDSVAAMFTRAFDWYAAGGRSFAVGLPFLLWIFGPIPVVVMSLVLVAFLYVLDMQ